MSMSVGSEEFQAAQHGMDEEQLEDVGYRAQQVKILTPISGTAQDRWEQVLRCQTGGWET